jgi:hypothetical protein
MKTCSSRAYRKFCIKYENLEIYNRALMKKKSTAWTTTEANGTLSYLLRCIAYYYYFPSYFLSEGLQNFMIYININLETTNGLGSTDTARWIRRYGLGIRQFLEISIWQYREFTYKNNKIVKYHVTKAK